MIEVVELENKLFLMLLKSTRPSQAYPLLYQAGTSSGSRGGSLGSAGLCMRLGLFINGSTRYPRRMNLPFLLGGCH